MSLTFVVTKQNIKFERMLNSPVYLKQGLVCCAF